MDNERIILVCLKNGFVQSMTAEQYSDFRENRKDYEEEM